MNVLFSIALSICNMLCHTSYNDTHTTHTCNLGSQTTSNATEQYDIDM